MHRFGNGCCNDYVIIIGLAMLSSLQPPQSQLDHRGEDFISFEQAVAILRNELKYPEDRALHFVKKFDHNHDGRLSAAEFQQFRNKIEET